MKLRPKTADEEFEEALAAMPADDRTVFVKSKPELAPALARLPRGNLLLPYQQKAIMAAKDNNVLVVEKSRRIGLTWGLGSHAALTAAKTRSAGGMDVFYMGYEKEMAREFIDVCGMWAKAFGVAAGEAEEFVLDDDTNPEKSIKAFRIQFASGFEIVALPSKPRAFRGKQGMVIMDEAAFMDDVQEAIDAAMALLMWGGSIIIVSTHFGVDNPFNTLINEIRSGERAGAVMTITFNDAIADGLYERVALVAPKAILPKEQWIADIRKKYGAAAAQELDCIPSIGGNPWIDPAHLTACSHPDAGKPELYQKGPAFHGYDVARRRDGIIQWTFEEVGGILWLREKWEAVNETFRVQREHFDYVMKTYRVLGAGIDQTGMGEVQTELLQDKYGAVVEGFILSAPTRLVLATMLRERFEEGTIRIDCSAETRTDLLALKRAGPKGKALVENKVHPDRFWAAALAVAKAAGVRIEYAYEAVGNRSHDADEDERFRQSDSGSTRNGMSRGGAW